MPQRCQTTKKLLSSITEDGFTKHLYNLTSLAYTSEDHAMTVLEQYSNKDKICSINFILKDSYLSTVMTSNSWEIASSAFRNSPIASVLLAKVVQVAE